MNVAYQKMMEEFVENQDRKDEQAALDYHQFPTPGKISIRPTKPCETARDLSLAYSPGVAKPCLEIASDPEAVYRYTAKGNLVAVISDGTAVLGLGDIGPEASKPVMEGKGILFKTFADIDVFDLELKCNSVDHFIESVAALEPTFGGINLEDIKAPQCFIIEERLRERLSIPVFHDDQHGTAIITAAALLNALEVAQKNITEVKVVVSGAGAAAMACVKLLYLLGLPREHVIMCDSSGVIYTGRTNGMNSYKENFAVPTEDRCLADAMRGADVFLGLSSKDVVSPEMLLSMAKNPIVFAMANPDPEIDYTLAKKTRADIIMATGRSDFPNQVNNVLGFPYIFRGALDVRAKGINEAMKLAAVKALAALAKEPVPQTVRRAYGNQDFSFGPDYLIPKPFDSRVLHWVAPAVAQAAIDSGLARVHIDIEAYTNRLLEKENHGRAVLRSYRSRAMAATLRRIALPEGNDEKVMRAARMVADEKIAIPVLIGERKELEKSAERFGVDLRGIEIQDPAAFSKKQELSKLFLQSQVKYGMSEIEAARCIELPHDFANALLLQGSVDGVICGINRDYASLVRSIFRTIGLQDATETAAGLYIVSVKDQMYFFSDTTVTVEMTSKRLAQIAVMAGRFAESLSIVPRIAMLSFSSFGASNQSSPQLVRKAKELAHAAAPDLEIEGEMQVDEALDLEALRSLNPQSKLKSAANVLIFPDMQSANISYKLLQRLGDARIIGPIILGLKKPAYVMQRHASVDEIYNMVVVAAAQAIQPNDILK